MDGHSLWPFILTITKLPTANELMDNCLFFDFLTILLIFNNFRKVTIGFVDFVNFK